MSNPTEVSASNMLQSYKDIKYKMEDIINRLEKL
jgi:hypothetical protein